jgi:hypothetical protein
VNLNTLVNVTALIGGIHIKTPTNEAAKLISPQIICRLNIITPVGFITGSKTINLFQTTFELRTRTHGT